MEFEALIVTMADTLLERKARTLIKTIACVKAMKLFCSLSDTVCKAVVGKLWHTLF